MGGDMRDSDHDDGIRQAITQPGYTTQKTDLADRLSHAPYTAGLRVQAATRTRPLYARAWTEAPWHNTPVATAPPRTTGQPRHDSEFFL